MKWLSGVQRGNSTSGPLTLTTLSRSRSHFDFSSFFSILTFEFVEISSMRIRAKWVEILMLDLGSPQCHLTLRTSDTMFIIYFLK